MPKKALIALLNGQHGVWYQTEQDTAALLQAIVASLGWKHLTAMQLWQLLRLTWITRSSDHWKRLKVPALAALFGGHARIAKDLQTTLQAMKLPPTVARAALHETGFVNFRNVWRNSTRNWCRAHCNDVRATVGAAVKLGTNDQSRFDLAALIQRLPPVSSPGHAMTVGPANVLTPLIACLDPTNRFPVINARNDIAKLLASLHLANHDLKDQTKGLLNLIGQFGISDAFMIDVLAADITQRVPQLLRNVPARAVPGNGTPVPYFDEAERTAINKSATVQQRARHNRMTNSFKRLGKHLLITRGTTPECCYDLLVHNYDGTGRDLLIEVKPDPDKGSLRIAIGQLLDYRRFLPHRAGTDLATLTITKPTTSHLELLQDLQITAAWFRTEDCKAIAGVGKAWDSLRRVIKRHRPHSNP